MITTMAPIPPAATRYTLERDAYGKLVLILSDGSRIDDVQPVRAFPIQAPHEGIALMTPDGHEAVWIEALEQLPQPAQDLVRETLRAREFMPEIQAILGVSTFSTPCTWRVRTDRGDTEFELRGEEDIRRLPGNALMITDAHGIHFLIRDLRELGRDSRRLLDRFM